jgi:F-type H+-transporting ATPase subunit b
MMEITFLSHKFWEMIAFFIFFALVGKKIYGFIMAMISENINNIEQKIKEVENLAFDSVRILEEVNNVEANLENKKEVIINDANKIASNYVEKFNEKLYMQFKIAESAFDNYLQMEKNRQIEELKIDIVDKSIEIVKYLMINNLKQEDHLDLIEKSLYNFDNDIKIKSMDKK